MSLKEQKRQERQAASEAKGKATREANIKAASSQKERALQSGGRYQEGGKVVTVGAGKGTAYSININENLRFSDSTRIESQPISVQSAKSNKQTRTDAQRSESQISWDSRGEASAPPVKKKIGRPTKQEQSQPVNIIKKSQEAFKSGSEFIYGVGESAAEMLFTGASEELKYGPTNIFTSEGIIPSEETQKAQEKIEIFTPKNTVTQKALEGRFSEINLMDPRQAGQAAFYPFAIIGGSAGRGAQVVGDIITAKSERKAVIETAKHFQEQYQAARVSKLVTVTGEQIPKQSKVINPKTGKAYVFSEQKIKSEVIPGVYVNPGGTEGSSVPLRILQTGKRELKGSGQIVKDPVTEYTKTTQPTLSPKEINIQGKLGKSAREGMGVTQVSPYKYATGKPLSQFSKKVYNVGIMKKQGIETTKGITAPLKEIQKGNIKPYMKGGSKEYTTVYTQTKAEKKISYGQKPSDKIKTPFWKTFKTEPTKQQPVTTKTQILQDTRKSELEKLSKEYQSKQEKEILFSKPRGMGGYVSPSLIQEQRTDRPRPSQQKTGGIQDSIRTTIIPKAAVSTGISLGMSDKVKLTKGGAQKSGQIGALRFSERLDIDVGKRQTDSPKTTFKLRDKFSYKLKTGDPFIPDDPPPPPKPPEEIVPEDPIRTRIIGLPPGPISSRDYDSPDTPIIGLKTWKGNVPEYNITGVYKKRPEITYSSSGIKGVKKSKGKKTFRITNDTPIWKPIKSSKKKVKIF